jgi:hypothetical protein
MKAIMCESSAIQFTVLALGPWKKKKMVATFGAEFATTMAE